MFYNLLYNQYRFVVGRRTVEMSLKCLSLFHVSSFEPKEILACIIIVVAPSSQEIPIMQNPKMCTCRTSNSINTSISRHSSKRITNSIER